MAESRYHNEGGPIGWMASNPIAANLLLVIVLIAGYIAIGGIRKEVFEFPDRHIYRDGSLSRQLPEEVEQGIVLKIEEELRDIVGIREIRSTAREGVGVVTVEMELAAISPRPSTSKGPVDSIPAFPLTPKSPLSKKSSVVATPCESASTDSWTNWA